MQLKSATVLNTIQRIKYNIEMTKTGNWLSYNKNNLKRENSLESEIIVDLGALTEDILSNESKKKLTNKVKRSLIYLAHADTNKFKAYANGFSKLDVEEIGNDFVNREWLFDVHFYTDVEGSDFMPSKFILACECEWSKNKSKNWKRNFSDIGYDFQKLLFCNSLLKLFICRVNKEDELIKLETYFSAAIENFQQLAKGSHFLFVCYCWQTCNMHYQAMQKL
jgi:hypothetical protein